MRHDIYSVIQHTLVLLIYIGNGGLQRRAPHFFRAQVELVRQPGHRIFHFLHLRSVLTFHEI